MRNFFLTQALHTNKEMQDFPLAYAFKLHICYKKHFYKKYYIYMCG